MIIFIWHIAGSAVRGFSNAQLSEHYANCMKLSVENKINVKNAFHLQLIDYMTEMMRKKASDMDNFQVWSITPCSLFTGFREAKAGYTEGQHHLFLFFQRTHKA